MAEVNTFRDLLVWQKGMSLTHRIYQFTKRFPKDETYGLTAQLRRSGTSVPSNIAEGFGRHSTTDYVRFLRIAVGSLFEAQTQIDLAYRLKYIDEQTFHEVDEYCNELERMLASLIKKLNAKQSHSK